MVTTKQSHDAGIVTSRCTCSAGDASTGNTGNKVHCRAVERCRHGADRSRGAGKIVSDSYHPGPVAAIGVPEQARASIAQCSRNNAYQQLRRRMPPQRPIWVISRGLRSPRTCPASTRNPRFRAPRAHHEAIRGNDRYGQPGTRPDRVWFDVPRPDCTRAGMVRAWWTRPCVRVPPAAGASFTDQTIRVH